MYGQGGAAKMSGRRGPRASALDRYFSLGRLLSWTQAALVWPRPDMGKVTVRPQPRPSASPRPRT